MPSYTTAIALLLFPPLIGCTNNSPKAKSKGESITTLRVSGSETALPVVQKLAQAYSQKHHQTQFQFQFGTNSDGAIQGLVKGTLDLAVANRPLSKTEAKESLHYHPFARDAVAFVAHRPSPVQELTSTQVRNIYGGKLTNWKQLGKKAAPIIVLDRSPEESARKLVLMPLMAGHPVKAQTIVLSKTKEMIQALESTPNSLGYCSIGLLQIMPTQRIQVLKLDGIMPSAAAVEEGKYPWYLTFGLVYHRNHPAALASFIDFVRGPEGRQVLEKYGYAVVKS